MKKSSGEFSKIKRIKGEFSGRGKKIGVIVAEFNEFLTERLLEGALDALVRHGVVQKNISVVSVPGAFEIPLTLKKILNQNQFL